jgi:CTP synthase (UTP-ammonia lyase)
VTENRTARVALVGDRSPHVLSHTRIPGLIEVLRARDGLALDAYWVATDDVRDTRIEDFDGMWVLPGSPYRSEAGALSAIRTARERDIPLLGTCGGFQHALLEYAHNVCGIAGAGHAETTPDADQQIVVPLTCSLVGHEGVVRVEPGSMVEGILGAERSVERYHCAYGLNASYAEVLRAHGLRFTGYDDEGAIRVAELPEHPFFLVTLFQPELAGDGGLCHPIVRAFAAAAVAKATRGSTVRTG